MIDPFRLKQSGGIARRLLDSAGIDQPSLAARRRAEMLAGTASSFSTTTPQPRRESGAHSFRALLPWVLVGATASAVLAPLFLWLMEGGSVAASAEIGSRSPAEGIEPEFKQVITADGSADEARRLETARAALTRGDGTGALAVLDGYDAAHPAGRLRAEAIALRAQALSSEAQRLQQAKDRASRAQR